MAVMVPLLERVLSGGQWAVEPARVGVVLGVGRGRARRRPAPLNFSAHRGAHGSSAPDSARFTQPAETAVVLGERQLPQRLRVSGAPARVDEGALARREDAILPVAQTARVQRVRARQIDGVASRPASAASLLRIYGHETPGALLASLRRRPWRLTRAARAGGGRRRGGSDHWGSVFPFRRDRGDAIFNAPELLGEVRVRFPLLV